jgi:3'(2'), 5'-bisphosphate nucleotidase
MINMNLINFINPISDLAILAGEAILEVYNSDFEIEEKSDLSPLTEADLRSHKVIVRGLDSIDSKIPIISEEDNLQNFDKRKKWKRYWLIDPLDGTKEFINKNGEFTVNIALIENNKPVLGVVHVPVSAETYIACQGFGAKKIDSQGTIKTISVRKKTNNPINVIGSRSHRGNSLVKFLDNLGDYQFYSVGSSLKFCMIAEGKADIYPRFGPTSEWDTAAAQVITEQAGGMVIDIKGNQLLYNTKKDILNPYFYAIGSNDLLHLAKNYKITQ